jgi:hypothetical protein
MTTPPLQDISPPNDERSDEEWLAELNRRAAQVRRCDTRGVPWALVRDELLAKLRQYRGSKV